MNGGFNFCPQCASALATVDLGGLPRRVCPACDFVHWDNPAPVVAALVERDGMIVLARNCAWPENKFGLITGFLERGETPEQGAVREVEEELALTTEAISLIGVYAFETKHQVIIAYHVAATGEIVLNEELAEYRLIAPERLRPWEFGTGPAVRDWLLVRGLSI